jgi:periplasmic divalent cation tolerance protein
MKITTSAGGVVLNTKGEVLVVNQNHDSWSLPKGHLEPNESPREAALREIEEESGLKDLHYLGELGSYTRYKIGKDGKDDHAEQKHIFLFAYTTETLELAPTDPHNPEALWLPAPLAIQTLTHPKDQAFLETTLSTALAMACISLTTTFKTQAQGLEFQKKLLHTGLCACSHLSGPLTSAYLWKGETQLETEWTLEIKTAKRHTQKLIKWIQSTHPYDTPQILTTAILDGSITYLTWVLSPA